MAVKRYFDLAAADLKMLSPLTLDQLTQLGAACRLRAGGLVLDVACGKGELLCHWCREFGTAGVGVDISEVHIAAARDRATELDVSEAARFEVDDALTFLKAESGRGGYDVVACIGGSRYLGGISATATASLDVVRPDGYVVIGEPYWILRPPDEAYAAMQTHPDEFTSLVGTLDRVAEAGLDVIDVVVSEPASYDRVWGPQWRVVADWLHDNPDDPDAGIFRQLRDDTRRAYLEWGRAFFGFATFVCRIDAGLAGKEPR